MMNPTYSFTQQITTELNLIDAAYCQTKNVCYIHGGYKYEGIDPNKPSEQCDVRGELLKVTFENNNLKIEIIGNIIKRSEHSMTIDKENKNLYIYGGIDENGISNDSDLIIYNLESNSYTINKLGNSQPTSLKDRKILKLKSLKYLQLIYLQNHLIVIGGEKDYKKDNYLFKINLNNFDIEILNLKFNIYGSFIYLNEAENIIYSLCGTFNNYTTNSVYQINLNNLKLTKIKNKIKKRTFINGTVFYNNLLIYGGYDVLDLYYNDLYLFDFKNFTKVESNNNILLPPLSSYLIFNLNNHIYLAGGELKDKNINNKIFTIKIKIFNLDENSESSESSSESNNSENFTTEILSNKNKLSIYDKIKNFYDLIFDKSNNLDFNIINLNTHLQNTLQNTLQKDDIIENYFLNKLLNVTTNILELNICKLIVNENLILILNKLNDINLVILINNIIKNNVDKIDFKYLILLFFILEINEIEQSNILYKFVNYFINFLKINNNYYLSICNIINYLYNNYPNFNNNLFFTKIFNKCVEHINFIKSNKQIIFLLPECLKNYYILENKTDYNDGNNSLNILYCYKSIIIKNLQQQLKQDELELNNIIYFYKNSNVICYKYLINNLQFTNNLFTIESAEIFKQILYLEITINEVFQNYNENIYLFLDLLQLFYHFNIPFFIKDIFIYLKQLLSKYFSKFETEFFTILEIIKEFENFYFTDESNDNNDYGYSNFKQFLMNLHLEKVEESEESTKRLLDIILFSNKRKKLL
ncbi:hypothetical protein ABK040_013591 [Willaertia magna]